MRSELNELRFSAANQHGAYGLRAAEDVCMQMIHLLPANPAGIHDGTEAISQSLVRGRFRRP